jgi:hypothetical protein
MLVKPFTPPTAGAAGETMSRQGARGPLSIDEGHRARLADATAGKSGDAGPDERWPWAVAAVCLVAAVLGWGAWMRKSSGPPLPVKLDVSPPEGNPLRLDR